MLRLFEAELVLPAGERTVNSMGSILHGALMEFLPDWLVEALHKQGMRPYSQSIVWDKERGVALWRIGVLEEVTGLAIAEVLDQVQGFFLRQKGYEVVLRKVRFLEERSYEDVADEFFLAEEAPKGVELSFRSPASFKRDGQYVMLPEVGLICQSLLMRWNRFSEEIRLEEDELVQKLASSCRLWQYMLRSAPFSLEGKTIRGFRGEMGLRFFGTDAVRRILGMLFTFAPFAGVGIKTALGMGAVEARIRKD